MNAIAVIGAAFGGSHDGNAEAVGDCRSEGTRVHVEVKMSRGGSVDKVARVFEIERPKARFVARIGVIEELRVGVRVDFS